MKKTKEEAHAHLLRVTSLLSTAILIACLFPPSGLAQARPADPLALHFQPTPAAADGISGQGEHAAAQSGMALQSLYVACGRNQKLSDSSELRTAISGLFLELQNSSAYDPARFARQTRQVDALLR